MDGRNRLIQIIQEASGCLRYYAELIADKLLAEGVIVPPEKPINEAEIAAKIFDELDGISVKASSALTYYDKWFTEYNKIKKKYKEGEANEQRATD